MFKKKYFSLISEKYINHIYPTLYKNADDSLFQANLFITFNKPFQIQFGGYITTNTQTTFYVKFGYNFWRRYFMSANLEAYFGQFYNSALASFKISKHLFPVVTVPIHLAGPDPRLIQHPAEFL